MSDTVHGLVCAPARKGKTTSFVMNALCHDIGTSRLVADMKGELAIQTIKLIEMQHDHSVLILNPGQKFDLPNAGYNPLQIVLDDLESAPQDAIADARSLAIQLHPEPHGGSREPFWGDGTRKLLGFVFVALCVLREAEEANLTCAFGTLSDDRTFSDLLSDAIQSDVLGGELSSIARNITATWDANPKHFESFREGAIQSLVPFGPSGRLATSVQHCDFRFRDLKNRKMTIFMICDPSRADVFAPWVGLMVWSALKELIREDNAIPVHFVLDEFTNYKLSGLPNALTALGGYGIRCLMVVQELEEIARVYGREALATILSQTDVKQFFGVASYDTAQLVSRMLGEYEAISESIGLGNTPGALPSLSVSKTRLPLMPPEEIRRLPEDEQIIFIKNLRPIRALKVGYHEIAPWRTQVEPNPLHDNVPFLGEVKLRIRNGKARATQAARQQSMRPRRPFFKPLLLALAELVPGTPTIALAGACLLFFAFGWPHLRVEYTRSHNWCRYFGPPILTQPFTLNGEGHCPLIIWKKTETKNK
ncbi:MAG: type IV secretory system conjugative DNA transfer family protein [Paracoccaceae bacterium]